MREQHTFVKIVTDSDITGPLQPGDVAATVRAQLTAGGNSPGLLRVEPAGTGPLTPVVGTVAPFADQPTRSFRCPPHRTDEHDMTNCPYGRLYAEQQALGLRHQPNPHGRTWGA